MAGGERAPLAGLKVAEVESTKRDDTRSWGSPFVERHRRRGHCRSAGDIARDEDRTGEPAGASHADPLFQKSAGAG